MNPARATLARWLYATALRLATPLWLARLWWRGAREPLYRAHLGERLGLGGPVAAPGALWVHAVSLGETRAAVALVQALRARVPGLRLLLTHGTATGREAGRALLQPGDVQAWLPLDTPGAARRFLARHRPAAGVLMETEVWPVLLHEARAAGVPMVLANARLSSKSLRQGQRFAALLGPAVAGLRLVLAQTEADAQRLRAMGAPAPQVCGNLKFDLTPDAALVGKGRRWREALGRPVVLAAVTREGEEAALLHAWQAAGRAAGVGSGDGARAGPLLVIVPRHPQRFDEVATLVQAAGLPLVRRTALAQPDGAALSAAVWLGDSLGEMALYYGLADVALLGGSFEPLGGQNLIEAAACGCPVVMGPHTFNFAQAAELALQAGAARRVRDLDEGVRVARAWLAEPDLRHDGESARAFAAAHRGAAGRMAEAIGACLRAASGH